MNSRIQSLTARSTFDGVIFADHDGEPPIRVVSVDPGSEAFSKGVRDGDTVVSMDGQDMRRRRHADISDTLDDETVVKVLAFERRHHESDANDSTRSETDKYRAALDKAIHPIHVYVPSTESIGIIFEGGDSFDHNKKKFTSVLIGDFEEDSTAPSKGLRVGDVLIAVNEKAVEGASLNEILTGIWQCRSLETLHLTFDRIVPAGVAQGDATHKMMTAQFKARASATYAIKIVEDDNLDDLILAGGKEIYPNAVQYSPIRIASIAFGSSLHSRGFRTGDTIVAVDGVSVQNRSMSYLLRRFRILWSNHDRDPLAPSKVILVDRVAVSERGQDTSPEQHDGEQQGPSTPKNFSQIAELLDQSTDSESVMHNLKVASMAMLQKLQQENDSRGTHQRRVSPDGDDNNRSAGFLSASTWMKKMEMMLSRHQSLTQRMFGDLTRQVEELKEENLRLRLLQGRDEVGRVDDLLEEGDANITSDNVASRELVLANESAQHLHASGPAASTCNCSGNVIGQDLENTWTEHIDPITNRTFWHNTYKNSCSWKRPLTVQEQCKWVQQESRTFGKKFWYNTSTGETTWQRPSDYIDPPKKVTQRLGSQSPRPHAGAHSPMTPSRSSPRVGWGFSPNLESPKKSSHVRDVLP